MPVEIDLGMPPAGYAAAPKRATDTTAVVQFREFTSTEDGQHFIRRLEGIPSDIRASVRWRGSRSVDAGEPVTREDFVDVERLELGVHIPKEVGALFIFSVGWRKGMFYDFCPVGSPSPHPREELFYFLENTTNGASPKESS